MKLVFISTALLLNFFFLSKETEVYVREYSIFKPFENLFNDPNGWKTVGNSAISGDSITLTSDLRSQSGSIWLQKPITDLNWKLVIDFHVHGHGSRFFGDGFAFWYTKNVARPGPVFGNEDYFNGLGVMFDTYSNHQDVHKHDHPYISAQVNDGSLHYDHDSDGTHSEVAGCTYNFRGRATTVEISYFGSNKTLTVLFGSGEKNEEYVQCFQAPNIELPVGYNIGFSAITGDLSDNHQILSARFFNMDGVFNTKYNPKDFMKIKPHAPNLHEKRPHLDGPPASSMGWRIFKRIFFGLLVLILAGITIFGVLSYLSKRKMERMKRFY